MTAAPDGCRIVVRVHPGARRERIAALAENAVKLEVTAAPERGAANAAVVRLLAESLGVRTAQVTVATGQSSRTKSVIVTGLGPAEAAARLERALSRRPARG
ncbi:MAG: DUF167 domain-containing protein [Acidobacteriota bacterium]